MLLGILPENSSKIEIPPELIDGLALQLELVEVLDFGCELIY